MTDDEDMGHREQGFYTKDIYDNGTYVVNLFSTMVITMCLILKNRCFMSMSQPRKYFIHKHLEKAVCDFVDKWSIDESDSRHSFTAQTTKLSKNTNQIAN